MLACGRTEYDPGRGEPVAVLATDGAVLRLEDVSGNLHAVYLDASSGTDQVVVARLSGGTPVALPTAAADWSNYASGSILEFNPANTVRVADGKAWFLGFDGVTVLPLDGTPSYQLFQPLDGPVPGLHAPNVLGAFAVDRGSAYVCYDDLQSLGIAGAWMGRFAPDGTWEILFPGGAPDETCYVGAFVADDAYVYWTTSLAIRAIRKTDGQIREVVDLRGGGLVVAPWQLAVTPAALVWLDEQGIHSAAKTGPAVVGAATLLVPMALTDPKVFSMLVSDGFVYWLDQTALWRAPLAGGDPRLVAHRPPPPGAYFGLAASGGRIYFTDSVPLDATLQHYRLDLLSAPR